MDLKKANFPWTTFSTMTFRLKVDSANIIAAD